MRRSVFFGFPAGAAATALALGCFLSAANAQTLAERANRGLVELMTSGDAAAIGMAQDLASVLDDGATRRLLPVVGHGTTEDLIDLKALHGLDMAIVQTDVLDYARHHDLPGLEGGVSYIAKLHNEELHLLARAEIKRIEDLAGKKIDCAGGAKVTGPAVLDLLHVKAELIFDDHATALQKLRSGDVAAMAYVAAKPTPVFNAMRSEDGLHFVAIPFTPALAKAYVPAQLTAKDYPRLVASDASVETVAVGMALMAANLSPNTDRYRNVANFVDAFFTQFSRLEERPHHPKWKDVNVAAELPGWRRFGPADAWLKRNAVAAAPRLDEKELRQIFAKFLDERAKASGSQSLTVEQKDELFDQFRRWQDSSLR